MPGRRRMRLSRVGAPLLLIDEVWGCGWVLGVGGWQPDLPMVLRRLISRLAT